MNYSIERHSLSTTAYLAIDLFLLLLHAYAHRLTSPVPVSLSLSRSPYETSQAILVISTQTDLLDPTPCLVTTTGSLETVAIRPSSQKHFCIFLLTFNETVTPLRLD